MAGFLSRLKSAFQATTLKTATTSITAGEIVPQPKTISPEVATQGFYTSLFGNGDLNDINTLTVPQKLILEVVSRSLSTAEHRLKAVPRLPSVIPRLLRSLRDSKASASDYVNIINKDPVMSAAVLKLGNSAYFNPREKRISSIEVAVIKLGIDGLRAVLSAAVMQPVIQRQSPFFTQFGHKLWEHSLCCAVACEQIAKRAGLEPYQAYLMGLVHDMGKITVFSELCQQYKANLSVFTPANHEPNRNPPAAANPGYASFAPLMHHMAPALAHTIATDWQLPDSICQALLEQIDIVPGQRVSPYAKVLFLANYACEIYARMKMSDAMPADKKRLMAQKALAEIDLPADLFDYLDALSIEV